MRLVLLRHTNVMGTTGQCYGRTNVPLAETFPREAASVRAALPPGPFTLHTSPALRCRRLAETFGVPFTIDPRLHELDFGDWEGRAWDDLPRPLLDRWCAGFVHARPPNGETFTELAARAEDFVSGLARTEPAGTVVVVTHAGVIRALLAPRHGLDMTDAFTIAVPPGSMHSLDLPGKNAP